MTEPDAERRTTVAVAGRYRLFADSIGRVLDGHVDMTVLGVASTAAATVELVASTRPDVAVVDDRMPDGDGASTTRRIRAVSPLTHVLILTGPADERAMVAAIDAGAAGFVSADEAADDLVEAVRVASHGDAYVRPPVLADLLRGLGRTDHGPGSDLTAREREILRLLALGLTNRAVAEELVVSVHTVRNHVQNILVKLGAHSKLEAVAIATRAGLLDDLR